MADRPFEHQRISVFTSLSLRLRHQLGLQAKLSEIGYLPGAIVKAVGPN